MSEKELEKYITDRILVVQSSFDTAKATIITAGMLVAVGLYKDELSGATIIGIPALKLILGLTMLSATSFILSFVFAERQVSRHDKLIGNVGLSRAERWFLGDKPEQRIKYIAGFYGAFMDKMITICNHFATLFLLLAMMSFFYAIISL